VVETDLNLLGIGGSRTEKKWYFVTKIVIAIEKWYFVTKIVLFSDREKLLKFEAEGQEFAKFLRSPEQFIQTVIYSSSTLKMVILKKV
jgi:hypothetical protein